MTTLVYRNGILAVDTRSTRGETMTPGHTTKIFRMPDGSVCGCSGDYCEATKFINWMRDLMTAVMDQRPADEINEIAEGEPPLQESGVVHMRVDGEVMIYERGGSYIMEAEFEAWGSGAEAAYGALYMGASAKTAVEIACKVDVYSGGDVRTMMVEKAK